MSLRLETDSTCVSCPYCGEPIELVIDLTEAEQRYIEDCFVCCRPMTVRVAVVGDAAEVMVHAEDEAI